MFFLRAASLLAALWVGWFIWRYIRSWYWLEQLRKLSAWSDVDDFTLSRYIHDETAEDFGLMLAQRMREKSTLLLHRTGRLVDRMTETHLLKPDEADELSGLISSTRHALLDASGFEVIGLNCRTSRLATPEARELLDPLAREWSELCVMMNILNGFVGGYCRGPSA